MNDKQQVSKEGGIPSPFSPTRSGKREITKEELESVKTLLGVECVFMVVDTEKRECPPGTCMGHDYTFASDGFSEEQLDGMIRGMAENIQARPRR